MQRVIVAGVAGAGKTTLARELADLLDVVHVELDALHHGPSWTPRPSFLHDVESFSATQSWVTEWQYRPARPILAARADTVVWLDYPTAVTMNRVTRRTIRRRLLRTELWNGNVEPPLLSIVHHRDHIVRWAWRTRHQYRALVPQALRDHPHLDLVHLRTPRAARRWLNSLTGAAD